MPEVVRRAMAECAPIAWANPSSTHAAGRASRQLLEDARDSIAEALGVKSADLVLTAGGTEACNLGIRAVLSDRKRVLTTAVEHPAVRQSVERLRRRGVEVFVLEVPRGVPPSVEQLDEQLDEQTAVAVQWINHETGTLFPIEDYARVCRERGARLFVDATQALGKLPLRLASLQADAVAVAAQKIGGPAGAGACWMRRGLEVDPVLQGGSQERGRRPGTPDTRSMVGFGAACRLVPDRIAAQHAISRRRDRIEAFLREAGAIRNGEGPRTGTVANLSVPGWDGALLAAALDLEGTCVSTGAACSSGLQAPSEVLLAMYPHEQWRAGSALRISLGMETSDSDIDAAIQAFRCVLPRKAG